MSTDCINRVWRTDASMAEVFRRLAGHFRGRTLSSVVDTALCRHFTEFHGMAGRCCLSEAQPQRWRGPALHAVMGYSSIANNFVHTSQVFTLLVSWWGWPYCPECEPHTGTLLQIPTSFLAHAQQRSLHLSPVQCSTSVPPKVMVPLY